MKSLCLVLILISIIFTGHSQTIGINTNNPDPSAALEVRSTTGGLLIPRMTNEQMKLIANPATGLLIFNTDFDAYYLKDARGWVELSNTRQFQGLKSVNGSNNFSAYLVNRKRYIWEMNNAVPLQTSIAIPDSLLTDLCSDEDGCQITLQMTNWGTGENALASQTGHFSYGLLLNGQRKWRLNDGVSSIGSTGSDGNNAVEHIMNLFSFAYFTDGAFSGATGSDTSTGLHLLKWTGYPVSTIIRLIVED